MYCRAYCQPSTSVLVCDQGRQEGRQVSTAIPPSVLVYDQGRQEGRQVSMAIPPSVLVCNQGSQEGCQVSRGAIRRLGLGIRQHGLERSTKGSHLRHSWKLGACWQLGELGPPPLPTTLYRKLPPYPSSYPPCGTGSYPPPPSTSTHHAVQAATHHPPQYPPCGTGSCAPPPPSTHHAVQAATRHPPQYPPRGTGSYAPSPPTRRTIAPQAGGGRGGSETA